MAQRDMPGTRVCVVGAGAAGLCAARHLAETPGRFVFAVFEQTAEVGGTWIYTDHTGCDDCGLPIHSSMYRDLRTNLPKEIMAFNDYKFEDSPDSFLHHSDVLKYLKSYCEHFALYQFIKFRTHVKEVRPVDRNGEQAWRVAVEDSATKEEKVEEFDAVIVCNGHFCTPYIPSIPGIEDFKGVPIHSHVYRNPEIYKERTVIILGANSSGVDICLEVSKYAKLVYLSHNLPPLGVKADGVAQASFPSKTEARKLDKALPCNITQVAGIESFSGGAFVLRDGTKCHADDLIFCTGYEYAFPFLHPSCGVVVKDKMVSPLYQHLIHIDFPTLCFVGLPMSVIPFRVFEYQVTFFLKTLEKSVALPSKEDMRADTERELRDRLARGIPTRHFHRLGDGQWAYLEQLARWAGCPPLPPVVRKIYEKTGELRRGNLLCYKEHKFAITGDDSYEVWR
ncbi:uncharacterized protein LOC134536150 isoform X4 [Bacillus rossius redtenbacheri]|uniref:uncharacterized protein LOC134536150 isoform X4 n=1 Tax=Bacillus rossius redtenbacheri TaxID=93214 RepID=UPI002FDE2B7B